MRRKRAKISRKITWTRVRLSLPDLDQAKAAVLRSLRSTESQRGYRCLQSRKSVGRRGYRKGRLARCEAECCETWIVEGCPTRPSSILNDKSLQAKLSRYVDYIVTHQRSDGWFSPYPEDAVSRRYDLWAILLANRMLVQYHEAAGDDRVLKAVTSSLRAILAGLDRTPLFDWGRYRWFEGLVSVFYVHKKTHEPWLLDLARKLRAQGFDCGEFYKGEDVTVPTPRRGRRARAARVLDRAWRNLDARQRGQTAS